MPGLCHPRGETEPGMSRLYDRIFWLERTLLAYEQAQLAVWRKRVERERIKDGKRKEADRVMTLVRRRVAVHPK